MSRWAIPLKRIQAGQYHTPDGRYEIILGTVFEYCDNPHPMGKAKGWTEGVRDYCMGGEEHAKDSWGVWDREKDDYVGDGGQHFDTMAEAREYLEDHLNVHA